MLSDTLTKGLERYEIGPKLRDLRLKKKMGLVQLSELTGLSPALLSKVERGRLFPTLPTLLRIALVFGVGLEYFFAATREKPVVAVVRRGERVRLPEKTDGTPSAYTFESLDFPVAERRMNAFYAEFEPPANADPVPHRHAGAEFVYVLRGRVMVRYDGEDHLLTEGDSIYFDSSRPHSYQRQGPTPAAAIVVTTG